MINQTPASLLFMSCIGFTKFTINHELLRGVVRELHELRRRAHGSNKMSLKPITSLLSSCRSYEPRRRAHGSVQGEFHLLKPIMGLLHHQCLWLK
jgi:hypothetical protein